MLKLIRKASQIIQPTVTCSIPTVETSKQRVKSVQSYILLA